MTRIRIAAAMTMFGCLAATSGCGKDPEQAKRAYVRSGDAFAAAAPGNDKAAVIQYRNALKQDPRFGEARLKLAETYERLGDAGKALAEFVNAAELLPGNVDVQVRAANALLIAGDFERARALAEKALGVAPEHVEAQIANGNALAGLKNFDAAVAAIEAAIRKSPGRSASYTTLGTFELARKNEDRAESAFRKAVVIDTRSVRARLALANFYWGTGRLPLAERELKSALAIDEQDITVRRALAVFYLGANRMPEAEPHLKAMADLPNLSGDRSDLSFVLADYYASTGRSADAKTLLHKLAAADDQGFSAATLRLSAIATHGGDKAGARKLIDELLVKQPRNVDALVALANQFLDDKMPDQALAQAERAAKADPRSASAQYALARVHRARQEWVQAIAGYRELLQLEPRGNAARLELARLALIKGKPDEAIQFAQDALKEQPGLAEATALLGRAMLSKGDSLGAAPHVTQIAKAFPRSADAQAELGELYALKGDGSHARVAFEEALTLDPDNIAALTGLGSLDVQARNPAAARARVDVRLARNQNDPRLLLLSARLSMVLGNVAAAEQGLRRVIEIDPGQIDAYALLGQFYASQHRLDEARAEFEKVARLNPPKSAVGAHIVVGMILQIQNRPAEAQARYEKVLAMDPMAAVAANNLAWIYAEGGGNLDVALGLAQTAKSQLANSAEVGDTLGWVYYKKGLPALAVPILRDSVERSPTIAMYHYHLGLAYAKNGNKDEARKALEQALRLDPRFDGSTDAVKMLAGLRG